MYAVVWFCLFVLLWTISKCHKVLQVSSHFDSSKWCAWNDPTTSISSDPELTELTRNHRTLCMLLLSKYCTKTQCCCIWLTCNTFQRDVSLKYIKVGYIWMIITFVSEVLSLVTRNYQTVCINAMLVKLSWGWYHVAYRFVRVKHTQDVDRAPDNYFF